MGKIESILRSAFPGRDEFTEEERDFAKRVLLAKDVTVKDVRGRTRYVPVGGEMSRYGRTYVCRAADPVSCVADACVGCAFKRDNLYCDDVACSKYDRPDGRFVWFKEVTP